VRNSTLYTPFNWIEGAEASCPSHLALLKHDVDADKIVGNGKPSGVLMMTGVCKKKKRRKMCNKSKRSTLYVIE